LASTQPYPAIADITPLRLALHKQQIHLQAFQDRKTTMMRELVNGLSPSKLTV
jgi:hypothetical protein